MKKIALLSVVALLCLQASAQQTDVKPLTVGDAVPDISFKHVLQYKHRTAKLSDFRGKVVILDFWSRYCSNCIAQFPKLDSLQKNFGNELNILLVNVDEFRNSKEEISAVLSSLQQKLNTPLNFPVVLFDSTFTRQFFKEITLPHYIWLNEDRKILAITSVREITTNNIRDMITGRPLCLPVKPNTR